MPSRWPFSDTLANMKNLKVGILGTGDVGQALGHGFLAIGAQVMLGSRSAGNDKAVQWAQKEGEQASTGTFADAAQFGDILVLATLWTATESVLQLAGPSHCAGKILIDATNPLSFGPSGPQLAIGHTDSAGEQVQRWLPDTQVVKAFNTVGWPLMFRPDVVGGPPDMFIAGNDAAAKTKVTEILTEFGWGTVDLGGISASRYLEPMCMAWVAHYMHTKSGNHAFKFLRKDTRTAD